MGSGSTKELHKEKTLFEFVKEHKPNYLQDYGKALVIVNPKAGFKNAVEIWTELIQPLLIYSGIPHDMVESESSTHIYELGKTKDHNDQYQYYFILGGDGSVFQFLQGKADSFSTHEEFIMALKSIYIAHIPCGTSNSIPISMAKTVSNLEFNCCTNLNCQAKHLYRALKNIEHRTFVKLNTQRICNVDSHISQAPADFIWDNLMVSYGFTADISMNRRYYERFSAQLPKKIIDVFSFFTTTIKPAVLDVFIQPYLGDHNLSVTDTSEWEQDKDGLLKVPGHEFAFFSICNVPWITDELSFGSTIPFDEKPWVALVCYKYHDDINRLRFIQFLEFCKVGNTQVLMENYENFIFVPITKAYIKRQNGDLIIAGEDAAIPTVEIGKEFIVEIGATTNFL